MSSYICWLKGILGTIGSLLNISSFHKAFKISTESSTVLVRGPIVNLIGPLSPLSSSPMFKCPSIETLSAVGLKPIIPVKAAGDLKDPPKSEPIPAGVHFVATRAASPPEEPPQDLFNWKGFLANPQKESVWQAPSIGGTFPLAMKIAPSFLKHLATRQSSLGKYKHL